MKITEFVTDEHYKKLLATFRKAGYKKIGDGMDAIVFTKDVGTVVKVIFPQGLGPEDFDKAAKALMLFTDFCQNNPSQFLPKFTAMAPIVIDGETFHQTTMEKLKKIRTNSLAEAAVWLISDCVANGDTWDECTSALYSSESWEHLEGFDPEKLADKMWNMSDAQKEMWFGFYQVCQALYKVGREHGLGWDMHTENVMQRSNGIPVVTDPWAM